MSRRPLFGAFSQDHGSSVPGEDGNPKLSTDSGFPPLSIPRATLVHWKNLLSDPETNNAGVVLVELIRILRNPPV